MASKNQNKRKLPSKEDGIQQSRRFSWSPEMIKELIGCLAAYKTNMEYQGKDFNADRPVQYEWLRQRMSDIFADNEYDAFGPTDLPATPKDIKSLDQNELSIFEASLKTAKSKTKTGYNRIQEKIKEIRQSFNSASEKGTRSGSGRIVFEYYEELAKIYKGSPSTEKLPFGIDTDAATDRPRSNSTDSFDADIFVVDSQSEDNITGQAGQEVHSDDDEPVVKQKKTDNVVPKLIDDKRRHMERRLSAAQRDQLLLEESRQDIETKRELANIIKESAATSAKSFDKLTEGFLSIGQGLTQAIGLLAQSLATTNNRPNSQFHGEPLNFGSPNHMQSYSENSIPNHAFETSRPPYRPVPHQFNLSSQRGAGNFENDRPNIAMIYRNLENPSPP